LSLVFCDWYFGYKPFRIKSVNQPEEGFMRRLIIETAWELVP
jgi:hypothetical protein